MDKKKLLFLIFKPHLEFATEKRFSALHRLEKLKIKI